MGEREQIDGLKAVAAEALDIDQVRTFLDARYEGHAEGVEYAGRGEWSIAYGFRVGGEDFVIRFGNEREDFEKDRQAAAYASAALPIPRVVEIGDAYGGSYVISTRAFGEHLDALGEAEMRANGAGSQNTIVNRRRMMQWQIDRHPKGSGAALKSAHPMRSRSSAATCASCIFTRPRSPSGSPPAGSAATAFHSIS